ncbi:Eukaryotic translation initiation factor 4E type 2 [Mortierella hygrophila]|uniref:Eukaryotic translation initiation factor 4E type 2 n=1 Tax=Mortierella hygrophila TaxID=979708 RepID=A0A9P6K0M1_9FUNG|nr:Eukaryotic translation initiation factor 4E type 2 [Mortierella hygrophila]
MDPVWGASRKSSRVQGDIIAPGSGGSKLVQLQRQSSGIGSGLPTLSTNSLSSISSGPLSSSSLNSHSTSLHGSGIAQPGLSAFLTGPSALESLELNSHSSTSGTGSRINSDYGIAGSGGLGSRNALLSGGIGSAGVSGYIGSTGGGGGGAGGVGQASAHTAGSSLNSGNGSSVVASSEIHPLHFNWVFWFMHRPPGSKIVNYESAMKKIATFGSVEDFWAVYSHLRRPHELPNVSDYHMFRQGVRPVWEDAANINGGKWIVRLKKGLASRYWENLIMAVIGDQFDVGSEICGIVLSIRGAEDILSIWNQSSQGGRTNLKIRDTMKRVLSLPADTIMEYKTHNDALKDNSSFRNTDVFR